MDRRVDGLLDDARLMAAHAARHGKLPQGSHLLEEIAKLEATPEAQRPQQPAALLEELDKVAKAIVPETISSLIARERGSATTSAWGLRLTPYVLGAATLILTFYLAFQSSQLHKADMALREYEDLEREHPEEKLYQAWKLLVFDHVLSVSARPVAQLDAYQKLAEETKLLGQKRSAVLRLLTDAGYVRYLPRWTDFGFFIGRESEGEKGNMPGDSRPQGYFPGSSVPSPTIEDPSACDDLVPVATSSVAVTARPGSSQLDTYARGFDCLLNALHVSTQDYQYPLWYSLYGVRDTLNLLVTWMLPGLYGLLGACVYLMRGLLLENGSSDTREERVIDSLSLVMRVGLGGLAGIIIGWFWVPNAASSSSPAVSLSSIPFGMAFLAGFSIDSLFTLLERLNKTIGKS